MSIILYRTIWSNPGVVEPIEVRCATDKAVWLLSGVKVPRHRDDYERYWNTVDEAMQWWEYVYRKRVHECKMAYVEAEKNLSEHLRRSLD